MLKKATGGVPGRETLLTYRSTLRGFALSGLAGGLFQHPVSDEKGGLQVKRLILTCLAVFFVVGALGCSGGEMSTREKGAVGGTVGGAALGGIIGAIAGNAGAGAAIGAVSGLVGGALIGDHVQGQQKKEAQTQKQIDQNQAEINRQQQQIQQMKKQQEF